MQQETEEIPLAHASNCNIGRPGSTSRVFQKVHPEDFSCKRDRRYQLHSIPATGCILDVHPFSSESAGIHYYKSNNRLLHIFSIRIFINKLSGIFVDLYIWNVILIAVINFNDPYDQLTVAYTL